MKYNYVGGEDGQEEDESVQHRRFGMNIMGVLSGQLYATKVRHRLMGESLSLDGTISIGAFDGIMEIWFAIILSPRFYSSC